MKHKLKIIIFALFIVVSNIQASDLNTTNKGETYKIDKVWQEYLEYWQTKDKEAKLSKGDSLEDIERFEKSIGVKLPEDYKRSLMIQNHYARKIKGERGEYAYAWFGDLEDIELFNIEFVKKNYEYYVNTPCFNSINNKTSKKEKVVYVGNIAPYSKTNWSKYWIPISAMGELGVIFVLDLRLSINKS